MKTKHKLRPTQPPETNNFEKRKNNKIKTKQEQVNGFHFYSYKPKCSLWYQGNAD